MNDEQRLRYSRHLLVPAFGEQGQHCLIESTAVIMGVGGLGSSASMYLAAAGVGHLILVDDDHVDLSNLQRQVIHTTQTIGQSKVASAQLFISQLNPDVQITALNQRYDESDLHTIIKQADVVLDCTDNFQSRFMINRVCVANRVPLVSASAIRMEAQLAVFTHTTGCYRCLYEDETNTDDTCIERGVLGPILGIMGSAQALEAVKVLSDTGTSLTGKLALFDANKHQWNQMRFKRDPNCPVCSR